MTPACSCSSEARDSSLPSFLSNHSLTQKQVDEFGVLLQTRDGLKSVVPCKVQRLEFPELAKFFDALDVAVAAVEVAKV